MTWQRCADKLPEEGSRYIPVSGPRVLPFCEVKRDGKVAPNKCWRIGMHWHWENSGVLICDRILYTDEWRYAEELSK